MTADEEKGAVWNLLLASGYLKMVERGFSPRITLFTYRLELTNPEGHMMFENTICDWFAGGDVLCPTILLSRRSFGMMWKP